jgi:fumarylacetoacetase
MATWVDGAEGGPFGLDNLPLGIYSTDDAPRAGVAIGDSVADLGMLVRERLVADESLLDARTLNAFLGGGPRAWRRLRAELQRIFGDGATDEERESVRRALVPRTAATMQLPFAVQDYVDFYSSIEHATNLGKILRPGGEALTPNYRHIPIGYHGRASTVVVDGTDVRRPSGQTKAPDAESPSFGPTRMLDFELELGFVTGPGNALGTPIPVDAVRDHVYGFVLLNDWSARDIQAWEYQPLGPFLSKSFATSISPWLVSLDALEPFRVANRTQDPEPLPYLRVREAHAYDIALEVALESALMRERKIAPVTIARTTFRDMYWNFAQQLAHLTVNGSKVRAGDLFGSGTISGSEPGSYGSMIELTWRGAHPLALPTGEARAFLENGDTVIVRGLARNATACVGFGEVRGTIVP